VTNLPVADRHQRYKLPSDVTTRADSKGLEQPVMLARLDSVFDHPEQCHLCVGQPSGSDARLGLLV